MKFIIQILRNNQVNQAVYGTCLLFILLLLPTVSLVYPQQTTNFTPGSYQPPNNGYMKSSVFRQEIARFEINVVREGKAPLPITQVPRVQQGDILKVRLLDEAINGIKLDQSQWDWTFLVTFINPSHRMTANLDRKNSKEKGFPVSEEIEFRKKGWYREYSFTVPYDSQPIFFLYPKPKYRKQLLKVVSSKYEDLRKLGEKTIELADAYSQIGIFLNELQTVLNRNSQVYGYGYGNSPTTSYSGSSPYNPYNPYPYNTYPIGSTALPNNNVPLFGLQTVPALNLLVEGLAKSFNIQLPSCWGNGSSNYGSYSGSGGYNSGYNSGYQSNNGYSQGYSSFGNNNQVMDFVSRAQCVARNVNLEDFDISVTKLWQQGGVFLAAELQKKYPQIAFWINIAAASIDFILKVFKKAALKIVPTIIQTNDNQGGYGNTGGGNYGNTGGGSYGNNSSSSNYSNSYPTSSPNPSNPNNRNPVKLSLFADSQPAEGQFVTAYPIVVHKWQANPDPEVISLNSPILAEPCLHSGANLLKSTDLSDRFSQDNFSKDFKLLISSANGFQKEFPVKKNIGLGGWELNLTPEDINQIPKVNMILSAELIGTRGFNEIRSSKFNIPISSGGSFEITPESQKNFTVGGKRKITLRNSLGSCRCLNRIVYKPSIGGQFSSEQNNLEFSADGREVSFEIDTTSLQAGQGNLEIKMFGNEPSQINQLSAQSPNTLLLNLYPAPPLISNIRAHRGDREIIISGERLEQIQSVLINGKHLLVMKNNAPAAPNSPPNVSPNQKLNPFGTATTGFPQQTTTQFQNNSPTQKVAIFEDIASRITFEIISLELNLEGTRKLTYPQKFPVGISRPAIQTNEFNEIDGKFLKEKVEESVNEKKVNPLKTKKDKQIPQLDFQGYPIVLIDNNALTISVRNILTDYDFKLENLSIETNIENATVNPISLPNVSFEVLDTNNLRINFRLNPSAIKALSGRRLQFRICDRERGNSDWYSIKQTFVRIPHIDLVKCFDNKQCELKGDGLDYISQISVDGGKNWYPQPAGSSFQVEPTAEGNFRMMIPFLINKKFLQIKLRDFPNTEGLFVTNFNYSNSVKLPTKTNKTNSNMLNKN